LNRIVVHYQPTRAKVKVMLYPAPEKFITFIKFINFNFSRSPTPQMLRGSKCR